MEGGTAEPPPDPLPNTAQRPPPAPASTATRSSTHMKRASRGRTKRFNTRPHGDQPSSSSAKPSMARRLPHKSSSAAANSDAKRPPRKAAGGARSPGSKFSKHCLEICQSPVVKPLVPGSQLAQPCKIWVVHRSSSSSSSSSSSQATRVISSEKVGKALTYNFSNRSDPFEASLVRPGIYSAGVSCPSVRAEIQLRAKFWLGKHIFIVFPSEEGAIQYKGSFSNPCSAACPTVGAHTYPKKPLKSGDKELAGAAGSSSPPLLPRRTSDARATPITTDLTSSTSPVYPNNHASTSTASAVNEALPSFRDVPESNMTSIFLEQLTVCLKLYDFTDPTKDVEEKEIKTQTLVNLVDLISSGSGTEKLQEAFVRKLIEMVSLNLFRVRTTAPRENRVLEPFEFDTEKEEPAIDPEWPHLENVYELLLRFTRYPELDVKLTKRYIDRGFIIRLLDLFDSADPREREYLKRILHSIYKKFLVHRPFIRKAINNIFCRFIFETEKHNGIAELLEISGSIISGFALPLKEEHKLFLVRALIPLHKPKCVAMYHQQLAYCVTQFVEKDCKLSDTVIRGLLKHWPITNSSKEVMFLGELEEVLEATQPAEFQRCMVPLFRQIARCLSSSHFQVAEKAHSLWNNDHIAGSIKQNSEVILPIIFPALERNTKGHWNQAVQSLSLNVRKIFMDHDPTLFEECRKNFEEEDRKLRKLV